MNEQIFKDSKETAKFVTNISGWVDRNGRFFGENEDMARYSGATHKVCEKCGTINKINSYCSPCHEMKRIEKYNSLEKRQWDGKLPLYSDSHDEYFFDDDSLYDYIEERELSIEDLQLRLCKPQPMNTVDEDYFSEEMHEDFEVPKEVVEAIDSLNNLILSQPTQTWYPDKYAVSTPLNNTNR